MNLKSQIQQRLNTVRVNNNKSAHDYEQRLLKDIKTNINAGQSQADNAGLIQRFKNVRPHSFTAMQQAFADAVA